MQFGAAVYFGFIRTVLVRDGRYVNRWSARLDLEDSVYRPALRAIVFLLALVCRVVSVLPAGCIRLLRGSVLRPLRRPAARETPDPLEARAPQLVKDIASSLSYGMLLFGAGFCVLLLYLFVSLFRA